ncbi:putative quinol monooxygenase [Frondihabitans cladoniiphilus]|uniref:ABM domain-containing protein n=1 Tax=Frondihabitans cladoniiphilus TaxID=715785 RepID=A0ABP8VN89_9MICO
MPDYVITNQMQARPGGQDALVTLLRELASEIHSESGGLHYSIHRAPGDSDGPVTVVQAYSSREAFQEHAAWMRPHLPRLVALLAGPPAPPVLLEQVVLSGHPRESFAGAPLG